VPTVIPIPTLVPTQEILTPIPTSTITPEPTVTQLVANTPTPQLEPVDHFWLERPIAQEEGLTHWLDRTYPYGGTQFGAREVHLGVEFVNGRFTPVLAAASGTVLYAGDDTTTIFGPAASYYGNLVVIQHELSAPEGGTVYTLYGHLQDIAVSTGQTVSGAERIGRIGDSGVAIGPHLHFEVRVGDPYDYRSTRNPDLWIRPYREYGTIAGSIDAAPATVIRIRSDQLQRETYVYGSDIVNPDPLWQENFTFGDLPAGTYEVFVSNEGGRKLASVIVDVTAGITTRVQLVIEGGGE
jgi:murein DD-endopeptidase MepM/ murein hydrolase activator NlpD